MGLKASVGLSANSEQVSLGWVCQESVCDIFWFLKFQMARSAITQQECHLIRKK